MDCQTFFTVLFAFYFYYFYINVEWFCSCSYCWDTCHLICKYTVYYALMLWCKLALLALDKEAVSLPLSAIGKALLATVLWKEHNILWSLVSWGCLTMYRSPNLVLRHSLEARLENGRVKYSELKNVNLVWNYC